MIDPKAQAAFDAVRRANRWIEQNPEAKAVKEAVITAIVPAPLHKRAAAARALVKIAVLPISL